jgi:hopanoid biosynthesis associated RND transporter like protein HpnN
MKIDRGLALVAGCCARRRVLVLVACLLLACLCGTVAATRLGFTTDLDGLFDASLPWKRQEAALKRDYPQFTNLIVAVIDARIPEEAEATADGLVQALGRDHQHFLSVRRPDDSPYLRREGLLFLDTPTLTTLLDRTVDASPFLGQLAADPSARGLFGALGLIGEGVVRGQANLGPFEMALRGFEATLRAAARGGPHDTIAPLSWQTLLTGKLASLAGPDRIVLIQPVLDYGAVQPGGVATRLVRQAAARLEFVASGDAQVHLTGQVPLADDEFASAAHGAAAGLAISFTLVVLWLFLGLRSWRLILPVVGTMLFGLVVTTAFAAIAVGTLNLISVAFAILFVGISVDFAIQFSVRLRDIGRCVPGLDAALAETGRRVGPQVLVAALTTAAGFLAFVPTSFRGVAELGLIAGAGMLIALVSTLTFLPAALAACRPAADHGDVGIAGLAGIDRLLRRARLPVLVLSGAVFLAGAGLAFRLKFDSNTLHTKSQHSEAMRTLMHLLDSPVTNPFTIDIIRPNAAAAASLAGPISRLGLVDHVVSLDSFVPRDQAAKLAVIRDAGGMLAPVLGMPQPATPPDAAAMRQAVVKCLAQLRPALGRLPPGHPLAAIVADLEQLRTAPDATLMAANQALVRFLPAQLDRLKQVLGARQVGFADIPPEIRRDYVQPDGAARLQVVPKRTVADSAVLRRFVSEVRSVAPDAGGAAVTIVSTAGTITGAFRQAAVYALLAIGLILLVALRRLVLAGLVLAPLMLSAAMTVVIVGLSGITLNYANIIALPLLLGVGVSFNIYFVMNWWAGEVPHLTSATTRAVLFSALTTGTAFGSLALSAHPGTASMGTLLLISLGCTLVASLIFVPAMLQRPATEWGRFARPNRRTERDTGGVARTNHALARSPASR